MKTVLDTAHAWFFESLTHELDSSLSILLVEGIKGTEREYVGVGETKLGPYFPVRVQAGSRCAVASFKETLAFFGFDESYDASNKELIRDEGRFVFKAETSSFRSFAEKRTTVSSVYQGTYQEYLLCCEDRIFHVLSVSPPIVEIVSAIPDLAKERTNTWSAS
jgi:hypothetical protein